MRASPFIAILLLGGAAAWVGSAYYLDEPEAEQSQEISEPAPPVAETEGPTFTKVRVRESLAETRVRALRLTGRTEADRRVELKVETDGRVVGLTAEKGDLVRTGQSLLKMAVDDRSARLTKAQAELRQRQLEYEAAQKLAEKNFRSQTSVAEAKANLESAEASLTAIRIELGRTGLVAPFDGRIEKRHVEIGDYVQSGDPVATLVDLDPLLVVVTVPERDIQSVKLGQIARADLITGQEVQGVVSFISPSADSGTRTFRVEIEVDNSALALLEGVTTQVGLPVGAERAHFIRRSILTLADDGRIGVRAVENGDTVRFYEVTLLGDDVSGFWVGGLPERVTLITTGQEWVNHGAKVETQPDPRDAPTPNRPMLSDASGEAG